ncbi:unnamed protein product [Euphydryas editha]|uniref:Reverse transcriptase RNase H-like domain-containing protein n=1 Tax=Euphydryas editha TaxID=104508 RepID=A0AAU9UST4_EUPED|nr:unnamed protein product [Euphydryas editha]
MDSSAHGVGAVLAHRYPDGRERPVSCISRTLNEAIYFGISKHHQYLFGRHFILKTDHKPLTLIFGDKQGIPQTAASRLQRWAARLAEYDYTIQFVRSVDNGPALLGHRLRGRLDALRPNIQSAVQDAQSKQKGLRNGRHTQFEVGEPVLVRNFSPKGEKWSEAHISAKTGPISYKVSSSSGVELRRHLDQILPVKDKSRYSLSRTSEVHSDFKTENDVEASCDVVVPGESRRGSEYEEAVEICDKNDKPSPGAETIIPLISILTLSL